jgi:hypothetical protein
MDREAAKQVQREAADVADGIGKADLLEMCVTCGERERKAGSRDCWSCIKEYEIY